MWSRIYRKDRNNALPLSRRASEEHKLCFQHVNNNSGYQMDYENIEVIDKASTDFKLRMKELLHILKRKSELKNSRIHNPTTISRRWYLLSTRDFAPKPISVIVRLTGHNLFLSPHYLHLLCTFAFWFFFRYWFFIIFSKYVKGSETKRI